MNLLTRMWSPTRSVGIIEPDGILNACTTKVRIRSASRTAMRIASAYSRTTDFFRTRVIGCGTVSGSVWFTGWVTASRGPQHGEERFLRDLDPAQLLHALLPFLLPLEELPLAGDVAAVALGGHVLPERAHGLPRDHAAADGGLDDDLEELARDPGLELLGQRFPSLVGLVPVGDDRQGVDRVPVQQDVELDQVRAPELEEVVVERGVAPRQGLQLVVEVDDDLGQREVEGEVNALADVLHRLVVTAGLLGELVDRAHELGGQEDRAPDERLLDLRDVPDGRELGRVVDLGGLPLGRHHPVADRRGGGDQGQPELALEPLLDDLHVEQPQEAASEAEAQRDRGLRLEAEGGVVEPELLQRIPQRLVLGVLQRVESREDHRLGLPEPGERGGRRVRRLGDRLADPGGGDALYPPGDESDLARPP